MNTSGGSEGPRMVINGASFGSPLAVRTTQHDGMGKDPSSAQSEILETQSTLLRRRIRRLCVVRYEGLQVKQAFRR